MDGLACHVSNRLPDESSNMFAQKSPKTTRSSRLRSA